MPHEAHTTRELLSSTVNDGEYHKMRAMLTRKCILLSQKAIIIETLNKSIKILNRTIFFNLFR